MRFTIEIPTYNDSSTIINVLESAINHSLDQEFEFLGLENYSTVNTQDGLKNNNFPCTIIIGKRKESTNKKTSLNDSFRENNVSVKFTLNR